MRVSSEALFLFLVLLSQENISESFAFTSHHITKTSSSIPSSLVHSYTFTQKNDRLAFLSLNMVADDDDDDDMLDRKSKTPSFINSDKFSKAEQLQSMQESGEALDKQIQSMQQTLRKTKNVSFDPQTASPLDDNVAPALRKKIEELQNARAKLTALQNGIKSAKQLSDIDTDQTKPKDVLGGDGKEKQGTISTTLITPPPKNSDHGNTTDEKSIIDNDDKKSEMAEKKTVITPPSSSSEVDIPIKKDQDSDHTKRKPAIIIPPPPPSDNDVDRSSDQKSVLITPPPSSSDGEKDSDDNKKSENKAVIITPPPSVSKDISEETISSNTNNSENQSVSPATNPSSENHEDDLSQSKKPVLITPPPPSSSSIAEEVDNGKEIEEKKSTVIPPPPSSQTSESDEKAVDDDIEKKNSVIIPPPPSSFEEDKPKSSISEGSKVAKTVEFSSEKVGGVPKAIIVPPQSINKTSDDEVKSGIDDTMDKVDIGTDSSTDLTAELDGFKDFASIAKKEDDVEKSEKNPSHENGKKPTSPVKEMKPRAPDDQNYAMSPSSKDSNGANTERRDGKTVYSPVKDGNPSFDIPSKKTSKISAQSPDKEVSTKTFSSASFNPQQGTTVKSRPTSEQISYLLKQQQDRETQVNRLKLQLNEFRAALSQTEEQKQNMETNLRKWKLVKKNLEDREKSDSVQEKLMQEKEDLQIEIKSLNDQIMKLGMSSESKFEELKQQSDTEISSLKEKIKELQKELHATSSELKSKEEELKNVTAINDKSDEASFFQGKNKQRDIEMEKITKERNQFSQEVQDLQTKFSKVEDELFDTINKLKRVEKELTIFKLDSQNDKQNDDFTNENEEKTAMLIEKYKTELEELKKNKEKELEQVLVKAESEKASLRAALAKRQKEIDTLKSEIQSLQVEADTSGTEKSVDSTIAMMKKSTVEEKKELEKKILDLQAKAQNAEVKLKSSTEEVDKLKNIVGSFQKQIEEMEKLSNQQSAKSNEKDDHDTLYYQSRLKNIILKAQKLMVRRRKRAESKLSEMKHSLEKEFEAQQEAFKSEQELLLKKKETELSELRIESDSEISKLTNELKEANMRAQSELEKMKEEYEDEVRNIRMTALQEKDDAIGKVEEKYKVILETEIQKVDEEKKRLAEEHKSALTRIQVKSEKEREILNAEWNETYMRSVREKKALREMVQEKNEIIEEYESERDSFRKMASRTIQNAGDRFAKRRKRNIFLKGNDNEEKE